MRYKDIAKAGNIFLIRPPHCPHAPQFIAARADVDVAVFRGPDGPSFLLSPSVGAGQMVCLLHHPQVYDTELGLSVDINSSPPAIGFGAIAKISETATHGVATYGTCEQRGLLRWMGARTGPLL